MSSNWEDFQDLKEKPSGGRVTKGRDRIKSVTDDTEGCNWGFRRQETQDEVFTGPARFIPIYELYLKDKDSFREQHKPSSLYANNPQKSIREWFENEGHEFTVKINKAEESKHICSLELPIDNQDFTITSKVHTKKNHAVDEICLTACQLLDESGLLYSWLDNAKEDTDRKRRIDEANKEDDIEFDNTNFKRHCDSSNSRSGSKGPIVNTYESLMAKWTELNMLKLQLKAKLVKLDLSVSKQKPKTEDPPTADDEELDPLDEFMSSLETKTKLSMDEKIEKSRLKSQLAEYEREQDNISRLIELAKPKFDLNKACPPTKNEMRGRQT